MLKGVMEELLDYLGFKNRYTLAAEDIPAELHPGQAASIIVDGKKLGIIGKIHPNITKDNVYVMELNLEELSAANHENMKYQEISKFPNVSKDVAFVVSKDAKSADMADCIYTCMCSYI